jgi:NAD(P)H-flavin reductase/ferredoxin
MARSHEITINGQSFVAHRGELLLDAALNNGVDLPYDCRAGHCGTCCVRLVSGEVQGGEGSEPGIVHACQCRIVGDAVLEKDQPSGVRTVEGVVGSLRPLSREVMEVSIRTNRALPYHAGQYAQLRFNGYPSRPFSITQPLRGNANSRSVWFHIRRMKEGLVTPALGKRIKPGHRVELTGPYGSAHFRPNLDSRLILVGTNTGFAPIWSIAIAALRENPERTMTIIAGGRSIESLYMVPALVQLARFPNVLVVPVCSTQQNVSKAVKPGRPTDYMPDLLPTDVLYACGAPGMVDSIKEIAARVGAVCYADPFIPTTEDTVEESVLTRAMGWMPVITTRRQMDQLALDRPRNRREPMLTNRMPEAETHRRAEAQVRRRVEAEVHRRAEAEVRRRAEAEARRRAEAEAHRRAVAEVQRRAEVAVHQRAEAEVQRRTEVEAHRRSVAEVQRRADAQAHRRAEAQAQKMAEAQAHRNAQAEERRRAEAEARRRAEAAARRRAEAQARRRAEAHPYRRAEVQAHRAEAQAHRMAEAETFGMADAKMFRMAEARVGSHYRS